jgi:Mn2+/Fe2+ NRAMP family transporter
VASKGLAGIALFSVGGTLLMFVLHFMLKDVYVNNLMDWVSFFGWMSLFSLAGFLLVGFGLQLIIKSTKTETYN